MYQITYLARAYWLCVRHDNITQVVMPPQRQQVCHGPKIAISLPVQYTPTQFGCDPNCCDPAPAYRYPYLVRSLSHCQSSHGHVPVRYVPVTAIASPYRQTGIAYLPGNADGKADSEVGVDVQAKRLEDKVQSHSGLTN